MRWIVLLWLMFVWGFIGCCEGVLWGLVSVVGDWFGKVVKLVEGKCG